MSDRLEHDVIRKAVRNFKNDSTYVEYIREIMKHWKTLSTKERLLVSGIYSHHAGKRCFTPNQQSAIVALYLKYKAG